MIARNAARSLPEVLESVGWADEICVADTGSSDNTKEIADKFGAKTGSIQFEGFGRAKQEAVNMAAYDWVFSLDSDEVVSPELRDSILEFLRNPGDFAGAEFSRITNFCGKWIKHCGWYPEYIMRIFDKKRGRFNAKQVHESVELNGKITRLNGDLLHYSYPDIDTYKRKLDEYARLGAKAKKNSPAVLNFIYMLIKPLIVFLKKIIFQAGFLDGWAGWRIALYSARGQFLKYKYALKK